jgi:DNA mismatch repair protein MutS2
MTKIGDEVYIPRLGRRAKIISIPSNERIEVQLGTLKLVLRRDEIQTVTTGTARTKQSAQRRDKKASLVQRRPLHKRVKRGNLDLHGKTTQIAQEMLEQALHEAFANNYSSLVVIHGKGSGAIRDAVHRYLETCDLALRYHLNTANPGETIVMFDNRG